jgi:hypothetical protein
MVVRIQYEQVREESYHAAYLQIDHDTRHTSEDVLDSLLEYQFYPPAA